MYSKLMPSHTIYFDDGKYNYIMTITLSDCTVSVTTDGVGFNAHSFESHDLATQTEALEFYETTIRRENPSYQPPTDSSSSEVIEEDEEELEPLSFDFDLNEQNLPTDELVNRLGVVLPGLEIYECESGGYPFKTFVWKIDKQGELTIDKLLVAGGFMQKIEWNDFLQTVITNSSHLTSDLTLEPNLTPEEISQKCQILETTLQSQCKNIFVYKIVQFNPDAPNDYLEQFHIIVGETHDGYWLGISPQICADDHIRTDTERLDISTNFTPVASNQILINTWQSIVNGLEFATTPNTSNREFYLTSANSQEQTIYQLVDAINFVITSTFAPFGSVAESEDPQFFHSIQPLDQLLELNLTNLREYVIGSYSTYHLYTIGNTHSGDWVGVSNVAIWS
jgi:Nuclease A inhibitor-like protein